MNKNVMIDAISTIDQKYIIEYVQYETKLSILKSRRRKRNRSIFISAACLALVFSMLLVSLPLSFIVLGSKPVQEWGSQVIENVLFPLDKQPENPDDPDDPTPPAQSLLQLNWIEWKFTEELFKALGAGTDDSVIDKLQSMQSDGFVGESMQDLGDFLERLYEYYMKHKDEINALPEDVSGVNIFEIEVSGSECTIVGVVFLNASIIEIPNEYNGYKVTAIGEGAFSQLVEITEVVLPSTVKTVNAKAFYDCESLNSVSMSGVKKIGESAFQNCSALQTVSMENVEEIDDYAFEHCVSLEALELTDIVSIGKHAFDSCKSLKQIRYGNELKALDDYAFANCESVIAFTFKDSITELGIGTFSGCTSLNNVQFDCSSIIPDYTFDGCTGLQSMIMYYRLENVGAYAFRNCRTVLSGGTWSVKEIGEHAFEGCGETTISLNTLESDTIDAYAMANCYNLWRVVLPSHIKKIEPYAMYNCPELEEIEFWGSKEAWAEIEIGENAISPGTRIVFNDGTSIRYDPNG